MPRVLSPGVATDAQGNIVALEFAARGGKVRIIKRKRSDICRREGRTDHEYYARPRMFVASDRDENIGEHLANRTSRPQAYYRKGAKDILDQLNLPFNHFTMAWSGNAGCRTCPCSPGFILKMDGYQKKNLHGINFRCTLEDGTSVDFDRYDIHVILEDAPLNNGTSRRVEVYA